MQPSLELTLGKAIREGQPLDLDALDQYIDAPSLIGSACPKDLTFLNNQPIARCASPQQIRTALALTQGYLNACLKSVPDPACSFSVYRNVTKTNLTTMYDKYPDVASIMIREFFGWRMASLLCAIGVYYPKPPETPLDTSIGLAKAFDALTAIGLPLAVASFSSSESSSEKLESIRRSFSERSLDVGSTLGKTYSGLFPDVDRWAHIRNSVKHQTVTPVGNGSIIEFRDSRKGNLRLTLQELALFGMWTIQGIRTLLNLAAYFYLSGIPPLILSFKGDMSGLAAFGREASERLIGSGMHLSSDVKKVLSGVNLITQAVNGHQDSCD